MRRRTIFLMAMLLAIAFAIQADDPKPRIKVIEITDGNVVVREDGQLLEAGSGLFFENFDETKRGFLGVYLQDLTPDLRSYFGVPEGLGVLISSVTEDGPAGKAGLKAGDVITAIDGETVDSSNDVGRLIRELNQGDQARIEIYRRGAPQQVFATVAERPRLQVRLRRLPEGQAEGQELMWIDEKSGEAVDRLRTFLESDEWKARANRVGDCDDLRTRLSELERQLEELQKKIDRK